MVATPVSTLATARSSSSYREPEANGVVTISYGDVAGPIGGLSGQLLLGAGHLDILNSRINIILLDHGAGRRDQEGGWYFWKR